MKTLTRTVRLAVGVAAVLAITAQVAQARPYTSPTTQSAGSGSAASQGTHRPITASARAADLIMRSQPPTPVAAGGTASARATDLLMHSQTSTPVLPTVVVQASDPGFDWIAAMAGAGAVLATMLLAAVAVTARGRRRIAVSN
jgi:hypothetical protein